MNSHAASHQSCSRVMPLSSPFRPFSFLRKPRTSPVMGGLHGRFDDSPPETPPRPGAPTATKIESNVRRQGIHAGSETVQVVERSRPESSAALGNAMDASHTAREVLKFSLKTLSSVSSNIPFGSILSGVIDPLLDIADRIEQTSANDQGILELAARIRLLAPVVSETAKDTSGQGRRIIESLKRELEVITKDLNVTTQQGKFRRFFNSADTASILAKHNAVVAQMIADSTFVTIQEVLKSVELQRSQLLQFQSDPSAISEPQFEMGDVTGGVGGAGGDAHIGGEGGEGEGPRLDLEYEGRWRIGDISGGTGGTGGMGVDIGGKGGAGRAPMISAVRRT
ncbi:hypothetical protein C8R43DRAFT_1022106 [Mycena crocata]|nr:hypothetical protein C8R43DRAFT_1022106 [Mycena crocata]